MAEMWLYSCKRTVWVVSDNGCTKTMSATHIKLYIKTAAEPSDERRGGIQEENNVIKCMKGGNSDVQAPSKRGWYFEQTLIHTPNEVQCQEAPSTSVIRNS